MLIFRFIIVFWVTARIGLYALTLRKHISFTHTLSLCFSSCLFKIHLLNTHSALIGQLTHAWASTASRAKLISEVSN